MSEISEIDLLTRARELRDTNGWGNRKIGEALGIGKDAALRLLKKIELADARSGAIPPPEGEPATTGEYHPLANLFPLIEGEEFAELVADIKANGLHEPVVILDGKILDGRNRYRACEAAGIKPVLVRFRPESQGAPLEFVLSKNLKRRHLNESQRAMVAARIANMGQGRPQKPANLPDNAPQVPQAAAARRLSISERALRAARTVQQHAAPELARAVDRGRLAVSAAAAVARLDHRMQRMIAEAAEEGDANAARSVIKKETRAARESQLAEAQAKSNLALPNKRYGVILEDPEWRFEVYSRETGLDRSPDNHYPTSTLEEIVNRPVKDIAADDCVYFLWATVPMLPEALKLMEARGFEYVSHIVAIKDRLGTGYWFRNKHELLLVGTHGKIPAPAPGTQWESSQPFEVGEHSAKPDWQYDLIESYFPNLPKIELNARRARPGWNTWGLDAPIESTDPDTGEVHEAPQ